MKKNKVFLAIIYGVLALIVAVGIANSADWSNPNPRSGGDAAGVLLLKHESNFTEIYAASTGKLNLLKGNSSGATAPTGPNTGQLWHDTVNNLLKCYNSTWGGCGLYSNVTSSFNGLATAGTWTHTGGFVTSGTGTHTGPQSFATGTVTVSSPVVMNTTITGTSTHSGIDTFTTAPTFSAGFVTNGTITTATMSGFSTNGTITTATMSGFSTNGTITTTAPLYSTATDTSTFTGPVVFSNATGTIAASSVNGLHVARYYSTQQTITSAGSITLAHGMGVVPDFVQTELVCESAEHNYAPGDTIAVTNHDYGGAGFSLGASIKKDATNLVIRFGSNVSVYIIPDASDGVARSLTNANWKVVFKALAVY